MGERVTVTRKNNRIGLSCKALSLVMAAILVVPSVSTAQAPDVAVAGTPQQANDRIRTLTMGSHTSPHDYLIGSGDLLSITVFDVPELSREVRVSQMGSVGIPLVPVRLTVAGLTELQAEQKIAEVLEANGLVSHAEVGVMVKEHKSRPITIVGAVMHPMVYEADRSVTLLEALAEAGGVANDAGDTVIIARIPGATEVTNPTPIVEPSAPGAGVPTSSDGTKPVPLEDQKDKDVFPSSSAMAQIPSVPATSNASASDVPVARSSNTFTINLNELLESGDTRNNIILQAGDVITVPHAGIVYVLGAVSRPGGFVMLNDRTELTTMKVLSLAGGLTNIAKLQHAFIIRRDEQGKQTETEVDLKKILNRESEDIQMRASDVLYIPDDKVKAALIRTGELLIAVGSGVALYRLAYR
jgi:polysaccharide biosynthesis/export protein